MEIRVIALAPWCHELTITKRCEIGGSAAVEGEIMIEEAEHIELLPLWEFIIEPNYGSISRREVPC